MTLKKILIPVDFSPHSDQAMQTGLALAEQAGATVMLFHVIPQPPVEVTRMVATEKQVEAELRRSAENELKTRATGKKVPVESLVVWGGNPVTEICLVAARQNIDLIVMGSHGRTGLDHMLIGSVAERVIRHAPCSILVTRAPTQEKTA
jgi:universal stress protein A